MQQVFCWTTLGIIVFLSSPSAVNLIQSTEYQSDNSYLHLLKEQNNQVTVNLREQVFFDKAAMKNRWLPNTARDLCFPIGNH